jgi:hypothetical protein
MHRVGRWMMRGVTVLSLVICVATVGVFAYSFLFDVILYSERFPLVRPNQLSGFDVIIREGRVLCRDETCFQSAPVRGIAFSLTARREIPLWSVAATALVGALAISWRMRPSKGKPIKLGLCPSCSYDLTGNISGVCPECGMAIAAASS